MNWLAFADSLAEELTALEAGTLVVIYEAEREIEQARGIQFVQEDARLIAELSHNDYLDPEVWATPAGEEAIKELGWRPPATELGRDNWWETLDWPAATAQYQELARMAVLGLRDGYRISSEAPFYYNAWNECRGNETVELPLLRLPYVKIT
ncbi:TY-Chap domain-containing protein [Actinomadura verrucosospora]|uniref:TY-Chap N-terminal domain-containing protein n=1 Tax=Actinomadura verrucosospora TaxID=46165 RepID=A0A7D4AJA7_ACTVE|nr:hypothetical protein [Actinomadura verrucosospora]QKG20068.1 hypothetical protein ACTIVE_1704 [Actinomadura verrucosospora]